MGRKFNRLTSILIAVTIIFSLLPMNFAAAETTFPDFPTGWSKPAMEVAVANGLISGYEDGTVRPKGNLARAEMATIITKAFGAVTLADISAFTDVKEGSWYYDSVSRAVKMGAISGRSATEMAPNAAITRQEVFTILARVLVLSNEDTSSLNKFGDVSEIASWAAPSMAALTERGYVNGDDLGNANPKDNITREEFAQLMYMAIRTYITERGTHTGNLDGITVIRVSGVTIKDANVTSDLVIGDGAGTGKVTIENVKVEKRLLVRGGAIAVIRDTELGENVVVNNVNGITYFDNYRDEPVFEGIVENTIAKFKERSSGGGGGSSSGGGPTPSPSPSPITVSFKPLPYGATWNTEPDYSYSHDTTSITLPEADDVNLLPGYELKGWKTSLTGSAVNESGETILIPSGTTSITIEAVIEMIEYKIEYYFTANDRVVFVSGYDAPDEFTVDTVGGLVFPTGDKLDLTNTGYTEFVEWRTELTNPATKIDTITITYETPRVVKLYAFCKTEYTVRFFRGITDANMYKIGESPVAGGGYVAAFPDISAYGDVGYKEIAEVASVYENNESVYVTRPNKWWYLDDNDNLVEFTAETVVNCDMDVYLLNKKFGLLFVFNSTNFPFLLSTAYNDESRFLDSVKNLGVSGGEQLKTAMSYNLMPEFYDKATDKVVEVLEKSTLVKEDENGKKNIQVIDATFKISQFVKEDLANTMIKKYLHEIVKNPTELDKIFDMIDVAEFADQLGIDAIIDGMSDAEIVSLMKSPEHKGKVIDFIITDLKKTDSAMLDFVIDSVIDDTTFRDKLIDDLIAELKNKDVTSALKTKAIAYIKSQIDDTTSAFYDKFVTMVYEDLKSTNSVVMDAVVEYVRTNLGADTQAGKDLRKEVLTSSMLATFLANAKMKEKVIELIITDGFIDTALDNVDFRKALVEAMMEYSVVENGEKVYPFIDELLASPVFHDYIVDQLHKGDGHDLATDVEALIKNTESAFRKHVLDIVKNSDEFEELFDDHPELKEVISEEFKWSKFVADENDFMKFVFKQSGVTGSYDFVSETEIEAEIATAYNALPAPAKYPITETYNDYANLTNQQKQKVYDYFYGNNEVKAAILDKAKISFNTYKTNIVNKIAGGKISEVTDTKAIELIDILLAQYVTKYIEQEELHSNATISASIAGVIEEILFGFISDLIHNNGDINDNGIIDSEGIESELADMITHIDAVKHQFVIDPTADTVVKLKAVVKTYKNTHADDIKGVVDSNYSALTDKLIVIINPEHTNSVYSKVEEVLRNVAGTIDSSLISNYVLSLDESSLKGTIKKYMKNITEADINKYIAAFLNASSDNVASVETELSAFITNTEQRATVEELAKTYINDSANETTIRGKVSEFIDGIGDTFVKDNRAFIEDALKNLDLSAFVDEQFVKDYVAGLDAAGKDAFADKIYIGLKANEDYSALMEGIFKKDSIVVTKSNLSMVKTINSVLRGLDFDSVVDFIATNATIKNLVDKFGKNFVKKYYDTMLADYCNGLDAVIAEVEASPLPEYKKAYAASLTLRVNPVEMLKKLYDKAMPKVVEKLEKAEVYYNDNEYLVYLVEEQDIFAELFNYDATQSDGDFTGYSLKSVEEYYDYLLSLLIVGDDALTWYGAELTDAQFDALYDSMIGKAMHVQEELDEILADFRATGELPDGIQLIVESVNKVNELITRFEPQINKMIDKYFASGIDVDKVVNSDKGQTALDILLGMDNPVFTIDMLYDIFYQYDDTMQAKLKELIGSGKLKKAIDKFESTSFGELFGENDKTKKLEDILVEIENNGKVTSAFESIYDVLVVLAEEGIDVYKTKENVKESAGSLYTFTEDEYSITIGGITVSVSRYYESPKMIG